GRGGEASCEARVFTPERGLGRLFNADSGGACHADPVDGGNGSIRELHVSAFGPEGNCDGLHAEGGPVIQQRATPALTAATGLTSEPVPPQATAQGFRTTPDGFGFGLLAPRPGQAPRA